MPNFTFVVLDVIEPGPVMMFLSVEEVSLEISREDSGVLSFPASVPGSTPASVPGSTPASVPGSTPASVPGSVPGSLDGSSAGSALGSSTGSLAGSVVDSLPVSGAFSGEGLESGSEFFSPTNSDCFSSEPFS